MKVRLKPGAYAHKFTAQNDVLAESTNFFRDSTETDSGQQFPKYYLLPIKGYPWYKNEIKRMRRGYYRGNNFQGLIKKKLKK